ncbi:MAG TPA: DUF1648 domain-containing protein, partial [Vicinamibacterales bacterium]
MTSATLVRPSTLTRIALWLSLLIVAASAAFLVRSYAALPDILPVHFNRYGLPDGWQYKTPARVLLPVFVQIALVMTFGAVSLLLLSRPHGELDRDAPDVRAATAAAEAVALIASIWVGFQAYAAFALAAMWQREREGLGEIYTILELTGIVFTILVFVRAHLRLGRPTPRPFNADHWRLGQLYRNAEDPALFVPTR